MTSITPLIVVHAGAGQMNEERNELAQAACRLATAAGLAVLAAGGSSVDACCAAVRVLEEDPACNAGRGSVLTSEGTVEIDAGIMDGASLGYGAVAAMGNCGNGVEVARAIMDDGRYVLLAGEGAWRFATQAGFAPRTDLIVPRARERYERDKLGKGGLEPGTVGACAIDAAGHLAAATSTGGTSFKPPGRVGDTPLPGCGTYADDACGAASATGHGESIARIIMGRRCCESMPRASAMAAAQAAVETLASRVAGQGGIICISPSGQAGVAQNTPCMPFGIGRLIGTRHEIATAGRNEPLQDPLELLPGLGT